MRCWGNFPWTQVWARREDADDGPIFNNSSVPQIFPDIEIFLHYFEEEFICPVFCIQHTHTMAHVWWSEGSQCCLPVMYGCLESWTQVVKVGVKCFYICQAFIHLRHFCLSVSVLPVCLLFSLFQKIPQVDLAALLLDGASCLLSGFYLPRDFPSVLWMFLLWSIVSCFPADLMVFKIPSSSSRTIPTAYRMFGLHLSQ